MRPLVVNLPIPQAPHLSQFKDSFSPLPLTPGGINEFPEGSSVFEAFQTQFLQAQAQGNSGLDSRNSTLSPLDVNLPIPQAPHLSQFKESFSPLPLTPGEIDEFPKDSSVFEALQIQFLESRAPQNSINRSCTLSPLEVNLPVPQAPHLSQFKDSFSPLPLTPGGIDEVSEGGSVFEKLQNQFLQSQAPQNFVKTEISI